MAKKNGASGWWRVAIIVAATLCFTTMALPFSRVHLPHRTKFVAVETGAPVSIEKDSHPATTIKTNFTDASLSQFADLDARMQSEYGAVLQAQNGVVIPPREMFSSDEEVAQWQANVATSGGDYFLQTAAAEALNAARDEARKQGLDITPRDTDAAARDYAYTVELWMSRVNPALDHWIKKGKLNSAEAERIRSLSPREQTVMILQLEKRGMFFSKDFSKSILCSVAPPGASQHLALLAFDVKEHQDPRVREILVRHGWYQTVLHDEPHFTYLGADASELPALGLIRKTVGHRVYWIPTPVVPDDSTGLVARR
jgi:hypothetical protein